MVVIDAIATMLSVEIDIPSPSVVGYLYHRLGTCRPELSLAHTYTIESLYATLSFIGHSVGVL